MRKALFYAWLLIATSLSGVAFVQAQVENEALEECPESQAAGPVVSEVPT
jgi:hypothetical protein